MQHNLPSVLPDFKERSLTYDMQPGEAPPKEGEYLVSIIRNRQPGSCYQVISCIKVSSVIHLNRYKLKVFRAPDMLPFTKVFGVAPNVTVKGIKAFPVFWYSRNKKVK